MNQGHGLVDRILLATPLALCPTLTQMENATDQLSTEVVSDYTELFKNINGVDENVEFVFDDEGKELLREKMDQFVAEVNEAIREGKVPPKSKTPELIPRVACALHVFNHAMTAVGRCSSDATRPYHYESNPGERCILRNSPRDAEGNTMSGTHS